MAEKWKPNPNIMKVRRSLETWQESPARIVYVNDEALKVVEVSIIALQQLIDLLKEAEQGIVSTFESEDLYSRVEIVTGLERTFLKEEEKP